MRASPAQVLERQASGMQQAAKRRRDAAVVSRQLLPHVAGELRHRRIGRHGALPAARAERAAEIGAAVEAARERRLYCARSNPAFAHSSATVRYRDTESGPTT